MFCFEDHKLNTLPRRSAFIDLFLLFGFFYPIFSRLFFFFKESSWLTYMAVEQAAFVTCNSFRLLEVFNRHFKLKKEEACKTKTKTKQVDIEEGGGRRVRDRKREGHRNKQGV